MKCEQRLELNIIMAKDREEEFSFGESISVRRKISNERQLLRIGNERLFLSINNAKKRATTSTV